MIERVGTGAAKSESPLVGAHTEALPLNGRWHVLHTKSRQEKLLAEELHKADIGHFLPLVRKTQFYGKRKAVVELPLFPGYLFIRGTIEDAYLATRTKRIAKIIEVADQAKIDWELTNLHLALSSQVPLDPFPYLKEGSKVEVRSGPLRGLQGFIESRIGGGRLILQVEMLGRAVSVEVHGATLEPL